MPAEIVISIFFSNWCWRLIAPKSQKNVFLARHDQCRALCHDVDVYLHEAPLLELVQTGWAPGIFHFSHNYMKLFFRFLLHRLCLCFILPSSSPPLQLLPPLQPLAMQEQRPCPAFPSFSSRLSLAAAAAAAVVSAVAASAAVAVKVVAAAAAVLGAGPRAVPC